jgi:hypothetical protein
MDLVDGEQLANTLALTYDNDVEGFDQVAAAASSIVTSLLINVDHSTHPQCLEAALAVGSEMYQARTASGGQPVALDFTPSPYRLSVWLTRRVAALTAQCQDVTGMVG